MSAEYEIHLLLQRTLHFAQILYDSKACPLGVTVSTVEMNIEPLPLPHKAVVTYLGNPTFSCK
jgi:hypothetical protein